jgi:hypothetical protein
VDNKLSFHQGVNTSLNKATKILGVIMVIKRTLTSRSRNIIRRLYTSLYAPRTNQYVGDMDKTERVQRRATKSCTEIKNLP